MGGKLARLAALVVLGLLHTAPSTAAQAAKDAKPPAGLQQEFDGFIAAFRAALKANDAAAVTGMTRMPFFNGQSNVDAAQFRTKTYPATFNATTRSCIQRSKATYDRDGANNDNYFIFCGQRIFVFTRTPDGFRFSELGVND